MENKQTETYKTSKKGQKIAVVLLLASFIFMGWVINLNSNLKGDLNAEKLKQDSILSTKLLLDKEISGLTMEIQSLKGKNSKLDSLLDATNKDLGVKLKVISSLTNENGTVKSLKKELQQLKNIRKNLNKQIEDQLDENMKLIVENRQLKSQVQNLEDEIARVKVNKVEKGFVAQNFRIELQRKKSGKVTVKSKKVRKIELHFDLKNSDLATNEQTIYVKIVDPGGNVVAPYITPVVINDEKITYTLSEKVLLIDGNKKVVIALKPETKLKRKGIYRIMVYHSKDGLIGSTEVKTN